MLDSLFPTYCQVCRVPTRLRCLCQDCWLESELLDPSHRCRSCFCEIEAPSFCARCNKKKAPFERAALFERGAPIIPFLFQEDAVEAAAGFALYQFLTLGWEKPDLIVPLPPKKEPISALFANFLQVPYRQIFRRRIWPFGRENWEVKEGEVDENMTVLLLDLGLAPHQMRAASRALTIAFPKKAYLLSLMDRS